MGPAWPCSRRRACFTLPHTSAGLTPSSSSRRQEVPFLWRPGPFGPPLSGLRGPRGVGRFLGHFARACPAPRPAPLIGADLIICFPKKYPRRVKAFAPTTMGTPWAIGSGGLKRSGISLPPYSPTPSTPSSMAALVPTPTLTDGKWGWKPFLGRGFPLRCFQRLSPRA